MSSGTDDSGCSQRGVHGRCASSGFPSPSRVRERRSFGFTPAACVTPISTSSKAKWLFRLRLFSAMKSRERSSTLGPGTAGPREGTLVVAPFIMPCGACALCEAGRDDLCEKFFGMNRLKGTLYDGTTRLHREDGSPLAMYSMAGLAEYSVVPVAGLFPLPPGLPAVESAVLGCAVFTAYGAVRHAAELRGGERVAVVACGGVGLNVIQIARAFGAAQIVAIDVRDEKLQIAKELGATHTVNAAGARRPTSQKPFSNRPKAEEWTLLSKFSDGRKRLPRLWICLAMAVG